MSSVVLLAGRPNAGKANFGPQLSSFSPFPGMNPGIAWSMPEPNALPFFPARILVRYPFGAVSGTHVQAAEQSLSHFANPHCIRFQAGFLSFGPVFEWRAKKDSVPAALEISVARLSYYGYGRRRREQAHHLLKKDPSRSTSTCHGSHHDAAIRMYTVLVPRRGYS